ncbi:GM24969 [Drosophila sechellia]|uniref:GM24969 n=1 Tax=Drosophila sechellia TaxID=7238 RepID=B4HIZ9_DROSE|nr:GM24969 [Drosophila sechellia]
MSGVWYLEHVTTGARLILHNGTNSVGRHSRCRIILGGQYQFVSREHANIIVSEKGVEIQSLNPLNGLFINGGKLGDKINRLAVAEGSTISLGVTGVNLNEITGIHAVFILKKKEPAVEEIVLSSDEDDTTPLPAVRSPTVNQPTEFNLKQQIPNFGGKQEPGQEKEVLPSSSNLHLPKLTEVKQEIVKHTSEEIQNIFGEPSDAILNSVLELNPYLYNKLTNKTASNEIARKKIHDGDCIELDTDPDKRSISEAQENEEPSAEQEIDDEEEYDESFAMSQAVIREMKAEMHVSDGEEDFLLTNGMGNLAEGSPSNQAYDDIVYISDSDDEELYDKVADWSKLLSQKVVPDVMEMSQTYPVENEQEDSDSDLDNRAKKTKRTLRILSSSDDDSADEDQTKQKGCRSKSKSLHDHVVRQDPAKKVIKGDTTDNVLNFVDVRQTRGPVVIEAPSLPKNRGKLRGVSAEVKVKDDLQRFIDYQAEMNAKWKQKPKDKKKEDEKLKECRREALKKLSEKPKENTHSSTTIKRKKPTNVPTVQNSNRGAFLTKGVDGPAPKLAKTDNAKPPAKKPVPKQPPTIETFSQQLQAADEAILHPQPQCSRPVERKEAELARNQRTCNKVTFAEMELYHQKAEESKKLQKKLRKVHFKDDVKVHYIERVKGASSKVQGRKECIKLRLSSYRERREWIRRENKPVNDIRQHSRSILKWANQWLKHGSVDAVAEQDVLMPIPQEFDSFKNYREIFVPLMKLELLSTIERDYKINKKNTFSVGLINVDMQDGCYRLVTRVNSKPFGKFVLYTLYCCGMLNETFANLVEFKCVSGNVFDLKFEILKQDISEEKLKNINQLTVRPVVDSLRVELGALSAVHQLRSSPLCRRILKPTQAVNEVSLPKQPFTFKGCHKLNEHQESIVLQIYQRIIDDIQPSLTLIQGPPGTGKSKVISELCLQTMYGNAAKTLDRKILICAHSNTAVDHIVGLLGSVLRVMNHDQFHLLRFGMHEKMSSYSRPFSLEAHFIKAKEQKLKRVSKENAEILKKQHIDLKGEIQQLKEKTNLTSTYLLQKLHQKEKKLQLISNQLSPPLTQREEFEISQMCVTRANIICTTLSSCVKLANYIDFFDICIVDEATQCTEPWTLLPMRFGLTHMVLVGDMQQLPAVVLSKKAIDFGLSNSLFDRIQRSLQTQLDKPGSYQLTHTKLFKLSMQYRMHPEICQWPNKYFYEDQLINAECTARFASPFIPYCVINLKYTRDSNGAQNKSISNNEEAGFVAKLLTEMDKHMPSKRFSYGIISPYQNQCYALSQVIPSHMNITPQTVDSYQGLEKDVIIISNARTRGCGFLTNYQRLNVALTRPRRCLVICGNFEDLKSVEMWRNLLDDARKRKVYFNLDRDDVNDLERSLIKKMMVNSINLI